MRNKALLFLVATGFALIATSASADFIIRLGDTVWVDGKQYSHAEWERIKNNPPAEAPAKARASAPVKAQEAARKTEAASAAPSIRTATCVSIGARSEFPSDNEKFSCNRDLGDLTREEILQKGWKIDLMEKIPVSGPAATSPRGLPLNSYKLILSR